MCNVCDDTGYVRHSPKDFKNRDGEVVRIPAGYDACPDCAKIAEMLYKNTLTRREKRL